MIGSGWATSSSRKRRHWDRKKRKAGKKTWYVDVDWDALVPVKRRLPRDALKTTILRPSLLNAQSSGFSIEAQEAEKLEKRWARHLKRPVSIAALAQGMQASEGDTIEQKVYRRKRDRKLRDLAMENSDGTCEACERDFSKLLDKMGLRVLQVHHRKQLARSDAPRITKLADLAVVCANCHSLIHFDPQTALPVEKLRSMLRKTK